MYKYTLSFYFINEEVVQMKKNILTVSDKFSTYYKDRRINELSIKIIR
jgi:hypothetical protein